MRGQFEILLPNKKQLIIPNRIFDAGEQSFLKQITRADVTDVSSGGDWYFGLCGANTAEDTDLSTLVGEPSTAGGYARQAITRDATGWPTIGSVNGVGYALTANIAFAASGADFSTSISRLFLCNVASGTSGILYALSGPLPTAVLVADGETLTTKYRLFLR